MLAMLKDADMPLKSTSGDFGAELDARLGSQVRGTNKRGRHE